MTKPIKVLMVDDEAQFRATVNKLLTQRGFETILAENGRQAIEKINENPDVVILDIKMPDMDGHETLRQIKEKAPETPVIMLTGHGDDFSAMQAYEQGALDYLTKPCDINLLAGKIKDVCHRGEPHREEREKRVRGIMIPIADYTLLDGDRTVQEAISELEASFRLKLSTSRLMETGHRSVLVVDANKNARGFLAITDLLAMILPDYLSAPKPSLADSIQYSPMFWEGMFAAEVKQKAKTKIKEIMSPAPFSIDGEASLMEATYMMIKNRARRLVVVLNEELAGVIREQDLFFEMAGILRQ
ncbi:MAG: response regulator [Thermodesulfobacteriota bacterium]|nr:response regulator [Thermodesulfobacteriota bacterium]